MSPTIRVHEIEDVTAASRVRHYDELTESVKDTFPDIVADGAGFVPPDVAASLHNGEIVKFTGYYRVEVLDDPLHTRAESRT